MDSTIHFSYAIKLGFALMLFVSSVKIEAQIATLNLQIATPNLKPQTEQKDTSKSLQSLFKFGQFSGSARYYFMATDNKGSLSNFYANAFGMGIGYESAKIKGFQAGLSGYFIDNLYSSDFTKLDSSTKQGSRYELAQFNVLNPATKTMMSRLEEVYLKYTYKKSFIKFGKQDFKSPFINPQDGRMRPTMVEGAILDFNEIQKLKITSAWLHGIAPRGTIDWFSIKETIGLFGTGTNPDGSKSPSPNQISTKGIFLLAATYSFTSNNKIQLLNQYVENVFNTSLAQAEGSIAINAHRNILYGVQYIEQHAANNGGNANQTLAYLPKGSLARTFGGHLGIEWPKKWQAFINYNRITKDGRFLMPREWGREPFFTYMPRERNEGCGDVQAINLVANKTFANSRLKIEYSYGHYYLPNIKNIALNKYGMPSYFQTNLDIRCQFKGYFKGIDAQFLYAYKGKIGNTYNQDKSIINRVNMSSYNLVLNFHF